MSSYKFSHSFVDINSKLGTLFEVGFADPAKNDLKVRTLNDIIVELEGYEARGSLALVNGSAALSVANELTPCLARKFEMVAYFNLKSVGYVVAISNDPNFRVASVIPAADVRSF